MITSFSLIYPDGSFHCYPCVVKYCEYSQTEIIVDYNQYSDFIIKFSYKHFKQNGRLEVNYHDNLKIKEKIVYDNGYFELLKVDNKKINILWKSSKTPSYEPQTNKFGSLVKEMQGKFLSRLKI